MIALPQQRNRAVQCLSFDGVDDYVDCGNTFSSVLTSYTKTVSCWFKSNQATYPVISVENGGRLITLFKAIDTSRFALIVDSIGKISAIITSSTGSNLRLIAVSPAILINTWYHVCLVQDAIGNKLYINGVLDNSNIGSYVPTLGTPINALIGCTYKGAGVSYAFFNGLIDDVRIYNRALTADEVANLYKGRYVDPAGLVAHWKMNERDGNTLIDSAGNNDGTIYGATRTLSRRRI